ncbi:MAG: DUF2975 domain-containing protein [Gemmatimonadota bacterium]|nr:MAG: DUF2975 domain-containing protein [Gemmatimonadota bacterium]
MPGRAHTSAHIVKLWIDVSFVVAFAGFCLLALWLALSPMIMAGPNSRGDVAIPVAIGSRSIRPVVAVQEAGPASGEVANPRIVDGRGELRFETNSWSLQFFPNLVRVFGFGVVLYLLYLVRGILRSALAGRPFAVDCIARIRIIGLSLIALGFAIPFIEYSVASNVLARLDLAGLAIAPPFDIRQETVFAGLLVLVLASIFGYGARLESDQSLTI